jgi:DNA-binding NarL/FixJ family response regulator
MGAARLLLAIDERTLVVIESSLLPEDLAAAIEAGRWEPPEALVEQFSGGLQAACVGGWVVATPVEEPTPSAAAGEPLSYRHRQVLRWLVAGLTTRQIALRLGIGESTVFKYVSRLKKHLGADTRAALVRRASSEGLLD